MALRGTLLVATFLATTTLSGPPNTTAASTTSTTSPNTTSASTTSTTPPNTTSASTTSTTPHNTTAALTTSTTPHNTTAASTTSTTPHNTTTTSTTPHNTTTASTTSTTPHNTTTASTTSTTPHNTTAAPITSTTPHNTTAASTTSTTPHNTTTASTTSTTPHNTTTASTTSTTPHNTTTASTTSTTPHNTTSAPITSRASSNTTATPIPSKTTRAATPRKPDSKDPLIDGKVIDISSAVYINSTYPKGLDNETTATYKNYSKIFRLALSKKYENIEGFVGIVITGFRKGSIKTEFNIKLEASIIHRKTIKALNDTLTTLNKNWKAFEAELEKGNIKGNVDLKKTETEFVKRSKNDWNKITEICRIPGVCSSGYICENGKCKAICPISYDCNQHGVCVIDSDGKLPICMCNVPYTGDRCEKNNTEQSNTENTEQSNTEQTNTFTSKDRQLIIEIASGAGGGVTLFLLVILVCVCIQWRRSTAKVRKSDENSLKETFDLKELGGKTNPIYDKDIESNVADAIPSRRGSLERRSHDRRESLERRPPPYAPSDGSRGYKLESFGKPLDYDRNSERNFIRRDDGRVYHVIDDGEPSNQTLLYQPSRYQQFDGSIAQDRDHPRYTDYHRTHSVYDRIDTSREYKIARPNFGGRRQNYDY